MMTRHLRAISITQMATNNNGVASPTRHGLCHGSLHLAGGTRLSDAGREKRAFASLSAEAKNLKWSIDP